MSDLVVIVYPTEARAEEMRQKLFGLQKEYLIEIGDAAIAVMQEGGKVYACRFALQALYGHGEPSLIPGVRPVSPLDVLDIQLLHKRDNAFVINSWTL